MPLLQFDMTLPSIVTVITGSKQNQLTLETDSHSSQNKAMPNEPREKDCLSTLYLH